MSMLLRAFLAFSLLSAPALAQTSPPPGVQSVGTGAGLCGGTIGAGQTGTLANCRVVNAQSGTSYAIANSDQSKLVTFSNASAIAASIAQAGSGGSFASGWEVEVLNRGAGTVTITPATSTINGAATLTLTTGQGAHIFSDGSNYQAQAGGAGAAGVSSYNGRTGAVSTTTGDYTTAQLTVNTGGSSPGCASAVIGALCSWSAQTGSNTVTYTNGSANIGWATGTPAVGQVVNLLNAGGALPTNFATATNYYVVSVVSTTVQISATPGGSAIVAGSAGTGTQTGNVTAVLANNVPHDVGYLTLGAGDWRCSGNVGLFQGGTASAVAAFIATSSNPASYVVGAQGVTALIATLTTTNNQSLATGDFNIYESGSSRIYLVAYAAFGTSMNAGGSFACRRVS